MPEDMPEHMPEHMPKAMPEHLPEDMPEHLPEDMPGRMPEDMPDRMLEHMSDRMPQDLPVTQCINVMVGITRSKVIVSLNSYTFLSHHCFLTPSLLLLALDWRNGSTLPSLRSSTVPHLLAVAPTARPCKPTWISTFQRCHEMATDHKTGKIWCLY